jgi:hypothetical protein
MHVVLPGRPLPATRPTGMDEQVVSADNAGGHTS